MANEGRFIAIVNSKDAEKSLDIPNASTSDTAAAIIGEVTAQPPKLVTMAGRIGTRRIVDMFSGE